MKIPKNLDSEQFINYFKATYRDIVLLDDFTSGSDKVKVQCKKDDHIWKVFPRDVYSGDHMSCNLCNRRKANLDLRKRFNKSYPTLKIVTSDVFSEDKTLIRCNKCKHEVEVYRKHLIGDNITNFSEAIDLSNIILFKNKKKPFECPTCKISQVQDEFIRVVKERDCTIIGKYVSNTGSVMIECDLCKTQYSVVPLYYISKLVSKCKYCKHRSTDTKRWVALKDIDW